MCPPRRGAVNASGGHRLQAHGGVRALLRAELDADLENSVVRYLRVEIHRSARRHGIADDDMLHAVDHALAVEDIGEDPDRWLVIGPARAANLLELVVLLTADGEQLIIHAMPMRPQYRRLLER